MLPYKNVYKLESILIKAKFYSFVFCDRLLAIIRSALFFSLFDRNIFPLLPLGIKAVVVPTRGAFSVEGNEQPDWPNSQTYWEHFHACAA